MHVLPELPRPWGGLLPALALALASLAGCQPAPPAPPPLIAPYPNPRSLVVAPLLNQSPSDTFDTLTATDTLVAELSQVEGLVVLPTERALKILVASRRTSVASVEEALQLARVLGVDGVLVGAVTDYEPYKPQKVGMSLQLFWVRADTSGAEIDPGDLARRPRESGAAYYSGGGPAAQVVGLFDAARNDVTQQVQAYAAWHQGHDSPFGWRQYLEDSDAYMHFVCHTMVVRLLDQELRRLTVAPPPAP